MIIPYYAYTNATIASVPLLTLVFWTAILSAGFLITLILEAKGIINRHLRFCANKANKIVRTVLCMNAVSSLLGLSITLLFIILSIVRLTTAWL